MGGDGIQGAAREVFRPRSPRPKRRTSETTRTVNSSPDSVGSTKSTETGGGLKITPVNLGGEDKLAIEFKNHNPKQNRVYPSQIALADPSRPGQMDASESYSQPIKTQLQTDKKNRGIQRDRKDSRHR